MKTATKPKELGLMYAGGLGPGNVLQQLEKIQHVANGAIWIDMETKVRTNDDRRLDVGAVESVLRQCRNSSLFTA